jgi:hypothetical protein
MDETAENLDFLSGGESRGRRAPARYSGSSSPSSPASASSQSGSVHS